MFDLSWTEILVIGTAAIIFIGPKELPGALKTLGQWAAKARSLAREFQNNVDDMIRESELDKIKSQVDQFGNNLGSGDITRSIEQTVDPKGEISKAFTPPDFSLEASAPGSSSQPPETPAPETPAAPETPDSGAKPAEGEPSPPTTKPA